MRVLYLRKQLFLIALLLAFLCFIYNISESCNLYDTGTYSDQEQYNLSLVNTQTQDTQTNSDTVKEKVNKSELKYILQWTLPNTVPFVYMGVGREGFRNRMCPFTNCIITYNRSYFDGDYTKFDVIAFAGPEVVSLHDLPKKRSPHQKYVFASLESADNYPVCSNRFDGFFNWTWTYRLSSEVRWGFITVRDNKKKIVGPNIHMNWIKVKDMDPISDKFKKMLKRKSKAAAWFVSNCVSKNGREHYAADLKKELQKYKLDLDIYGYCGDLTCAPFDGNKCDRLLQKTYYFYLSFENSFSKDYVTEKLLRALQNDVVPIVYGGANYSRFMPDGIYLNARELGVTEMAIKMNELIKDPDKYAEYFKWKKYYKYHSKYVSFETAPYCLFCAILNDEKMVKKTTVYKNFREWWDPPGPC